jgi:hypothetical protein
MVGYRGHAGLDQWNDRALNVLIVADRFTVT